jgi:hypothetical protein
MAILTKGQTFANGDDVTSTKLNNLVDAAAFVSGASGTTDDSSLEVNGSGRLQVKDSGVSSAKIAAGAVTTAKLPNSTLATDGVTYAKLQQVANMRAIGNTSGSLAVAAEIPILDEDAMGSDSATSLATQQSIKAYVDNAFTFGTIVSASGTELNVTGIPSTAKRIIVSFNALSTNGTTALGLRIGDSGGIESTGYLGAFGDNSGNSALTTAFGVIVTATAASTYSGSITLTKFDDSVNTWIASGVVASSAGSVTSSAGSKTLTDVLDRIRVISFSGDTFDAGSINIAYEY